jgi:DNA-binding CsgD family transcriptional regulator
VYVVRNDRRSGRRAAAAINRAIPVELMARSCADQEEVEAEPLAWRVDPLHPDYFARHRATRGDVDGLSCDMRLNPTVSADGRCVRLLGPELLASPSTRRAAMPSPLGRTADDALGPVLVLERFGVPWARFDATGRLLGVSTVASELLGSALAVALQQASRLVGELVTAVRVRRGEPATRSAPAVDGRLMLRAQLLATGDGEEFTLVLFLPVHREHAGHSAPSWGLSTRETEVARQIALGASTKDVAGRLGISLHTARRHTEHVFAKLGVQSRAQVVLLFAGAG